MKINKTDLQNKITDQLLYNKLANNSNISDKSSLLGDYGGTNPVQNPSNTQTKKTKGNNNFFQ